MPKVKKNTKDYFPKLRGGGKRSKKSSAKKNKRVKYIEGGTNQHAVPTSFTNTHAQLTSNQAPLVNDPEAARQELEATANTIRNRQRMFHEEDTAEKQALKEANKQKGQAAAAEGLGAVKKLTSTAKDVKAAKAAANLASVGQATKSVVPTANLAKDLVGTAGTTTDLLTTLNTIPSAVPGTAATAASGAAGTAGGFAAGTWAGPVGALATAAGTGIEVASDDQDATTMNAGETTGKLIKGAGYGASAVGLASTLGIIGASNSWNPVGWAALIGAGIAGGVGLHQRNKARRADEKVQKRRADEMSRLRSRQHEQFAEANTTTGRDVGFNVGSSVGNSYLGGDQMAQGGGMRRYQAGEMLPPTRVQGNTTMNTSSIGRNNKERFINNFTSSGVQTNLDDGARAEYTMSDVSKPNWRGKQKTRYEDDYTWYNPQGDITSHSETSINNRGRRTERGYNINPETGRKDRFGTGLFRESGGRKVPGGEIVPLGGGAVEFKGNKHGQSGKGSDSGIIAQAGVEVEGGETMGKVNFADGEQNDYIFSSYLKLGGKSFAQRHKDILQNGGGQDQLQELAKMQEEKAKKVKKTPVGPTDQDGPRGEKYIARYGGVKPRIKAQNGGFTPVGNLGGEGIDQVQPSKGGGFYGDSELNAFRDRFASDLLPGYLQDAAKNLMPKDAGSVETFQTAYNTYLGDIYDEQNFGPDYPGGDEQRDADRNKWILDTGFNPTAGPGYATLDSKFGEYTATRPIYSGTGSPPGTNGEDGEGRMEPLPPQEIPNDVEALKKLQLPEGEEAEDPLPRIDPPRTRAVPPLAYLGAASQALGPAMALATKYNQPERIAPDMQGPERFGRVNYNAERAVNANNTTAVNRFIQNSGAGPGGIAAQIAGNEGARQGALKIANEESKQNKALAGAEKQLNATITSKNISNKMHADQYNSALQYARDTLEYEKRIAAFTSLGNIGGQTAKDVLEYKATAREARAGQIAGEYTRQEYTEALTNRPKYRRMLKKAGIDPNDIHTVRRIAAQMWDPNKTLAELDQAVRDYLAANPQKPQSGGYIRQKYGQINR